MGKKREREKCERQRSKRESVSEMRRDEGSRNETRTCGGVELQEAKKQGEDRPTHQALMSPLGSISLAFKTKRTLVVEIPSLLHLYTAAKTKLQYRDDIQSEGFKCSN